MVFAFAGDSTITTDEPAEASVPVSISVTVVLFVRFAAVFRAAISVYRFLAFLHRRRQASPFDQRAQIFGRDAPVDLNQRPFDQVLELEWGDRPCAREGE